MPTHRKRRASTRKRARTTRTKRTANLKKKQTSVKRTARREKPVLRGLGAGGPDLTLGQKVPNQSERDVVGASTTKIVRGTPAFAALVENRNPAVVYKDEEHTGADRMMTAKLSARVDALASLVSAEWSGVRLRVTEAWDENIEHGPNSVHYEARAVDLTTSDVDGGKLGRLGRLAVDAGFDWVFFENPKHVHASMAK